jgi:hypothetical protein
MLLSIKRVLTPLNGPGFDFPEWMKPEEANGHDIVTTVVVCDTDGKNQKTIVSAKSKDRQGTITGLDWR